MLIRDIRFNVSSIGRNGDEPILTVVLQKIHVREHGSRIFGAETDDVHNGRVKAIAADLTRIIGIAHTDKSRLQPVCKPFGVERRYICSLSSVDDHTAAPDYSVKTALLVTNLIVAEIIAVVIAVFISNQR